MLPISPPTNPIPPPPPQTTPPVSEPMPPSIPPELPKTFPKWIIIGVILLLLAAISIFAYKLILKNKPTTPPEPTPLSTEAPAKEDDETANWKTYTNPLAEYLLKYPQSWEVQEYPDADLPYILHRLELLKNNKPQLVIETYKEFLVKAVPEDKVIRSEQITISGVTGTKNWHNSFGPPVEIIVSPGAKTYRILPQDVSANQTVDQILSTFKFTNPSQSPEPLIMDMKVYRNAALGFMIRYPSGIQVTKELNDQYNRLATFEGNNLKFEVSLRQDTNNTPLDQYYFMDAPISGQTTLGGLNANIYKLSNGYCDGPSCSQPFVAIVTKKNNDFFSLSFFGDAELSEQEKVIISTVQFNVGI